MKERVCIIVAYFGKFPITGKRYFDIHLINSCHVETCCLLSRKYLFAKDHKENDKNN